MYCKAIRIHTVPKNILFQLDNDTVNKTLQFILRYYISVITAAAVCGAGAAQRQAFVTQGQSRPIDVLRTIFTK